jgi:hypothetical protein
MPILAGNFLTYVDEYVTIMRPLRSVYPRGENSGKHRDPTISLRVPADDLATITEAFELLDMDRSAFLRWCAVAVAKDIIRQKKEYDNERDKG